MRKSFVLLILFVFSFATYSNAQKELAMGNDLFANLDYALAISKYQEALKKKKTYEATKKLAICYDRIDNTIKAEEYYKLALDFPSYEPELVFRYAEMLRTNGNYFRAQEQYRLYAVSEPSKADESLQLAKYCDLALKWIKNPEDYNISNVSEINSEYSDFSPTFFKNGLVFVSDRGTNNSKKKNNVYGWTGTPYVNLFFAAKIGEESYTGANPFTNQINTLFHTGPAVFIDNDSTIFYNRTNEIEEKQLKELKGESKGTKKLLDLTKEETDNGYINKLQIYSAVYSGGQWKNVLAFNHNSYDYSLRHPAVTANGKRIYFSSDMPGGYGGYDIYYCDKLNDTLWSNPINCGPVLNTERNEGFVSIAKDGAFYFASNGHPGMGGLDMFKAKGKGGLEWTEVENLKFPLNSAKDDFGIIWDESNESGYFSSNRQGGLGKDDIYFFKYSGKQAPKFVLCVSTKEKFEDAKGNEVIRPLDSAVVDIKTVQKDSLISIFYSLEKEDGCNAVVVQRDYKIRGVKYGYFTKTATASTMGLTESDTIYVDLILEKIVEGKEIVIKNIYYDYDKSFIRPDAARELDKVVELLQMNPSIQIELGSHTDARGSDAYNEKLSQRRAQSAVDYIIKNGISPARITAKGYGENQIRNRCANGVTCDDEEHEYNRRTSFRVVGIIPNTDVKVEEGFPAKK